MCVCVCVHMCISICILTVEHVYKCITCIQEALHKPVLCYSVSN